MHHLRWFSSRMSGEQSTKEEWRMGMLEKSATRTLKIAYYPEPVLRKKAVPVERITPDILHFIEEMGEAMYDHSGVGLAAPQVGVSLRIIVLDAGEGQGLQEFINPQIILREGAQTGVEGCLSLPGLHGDVVRAERVILRAQNRRGAAEGLQHRFHSLQNCRRGYRTLPHLDLSEQQSHGRQNGF